MTVANPEQMLFASTTQAFLDKEASLSHVRGLHDAGRLIPDTDWWQRAAELGWASLLVPEELGGGSVSGDGVADLALVAEQIGRTVAPGPLHPVSVVLAGLVEAPGGHEAIHRDRWCPANRWRPGRCTNPSRPFAPLRAEHHRHAHRRLRLPDRRRQGPGRGRRRQRRAAGGRRPATAQIAAVPGADRRSRRHGHPAELRRLVKRYARVQFDGVEVDESAVVGTAEQTPAIIERQRQVALVLQCAEIVGILDAVLAHDQPVAVRPAQLRSAAGLLSGPQAPRRGHEDVVRSVPGHHRGRPLPRWRRAPPTRRSSSASRKPMWRNARR